MVEERKVLSPRQAWVPSCFGGFGCADTAGENDFDVDIKTTRSAPILILKGLGTMTLGRLGEKNYILKDDIVTWKQRIEDSLFVGWITYTTRSSLPDELHELAIDTKYVSRADEAKLSIVAVDDIEECSAYDVVHRLTAKEGASKTLLQVLQVLDECDFSGALRLINDFLQDHHAATEEKNQPPLLEDTLTTAFAMHNKGVLEMANGIFKYAVYYFKEAADIKEALLGPKHNSVLETLEQLAIAMYGMGAYDQSHATLRSIHSRSHSRVLAARTWNAIACLHFQKGEYDFALKCAERAVILHEEKEVMQTIALANQGYMQLIGDIKEGRKTLKVADEHLSGWLGADNEIVKSVRYNLNQ